MKPNRSKYKGRGWHGESYRHYLAAKGIKKHRGYFKFVKDTTIPVVEDPGSFRSVIETRKQLMSPDDALELIFGTGADAHSLASWNASSTRKAIEGYEKGKAIPAAVIYFEKNEEGQWIPQGHDHFEAVLAARELGVDKIPVALVKNRPYKSTGFMKGEFEFSENEKELARKQQEVMNKAGLFVENESPGIHKITADRSKLKDEEKLLLEDRNIRESFLVDSVPDDDRFIRKGEQWYFE